MRFLLSKQGQVFSTRSRGVMLLDRLEQEIADAPTVEVDFDGVRSISYSFADEFVGELLERASAGRYRCSLVLTNLSPESERVIADSLHRRHVDASAWLGETFAASA